ncbi:MAG: hypothetical protein ABJM39_06180 [Porticoccus sp.]|uniref:hypothetical protein n=1 Tax=Porticoccus sp. TaxID=2024853 RepID=UPI00329958CC
MTILFAILMVMQTLSVASDVLPSNSGDIRHNQAHSHASVGDLSPSADGRQDSGDLPLPDHCHGGHCHGSHLLLAVHVFGLPLLISEYVVPGYTAQNTSAHVDTILRPPIA